LDLQELKSGRKLLELASLDCKSEKKLQGFKNVIGSDWRFSFSQTISSELKHIASRNLVYPSVAKGWQDPGSCYRFHMLPMLLAMHTAVQLKP
jgi:hypothetical protein